MPHVKHRKMTQEDKDTILEMRRQGFSLDEISERLGYCYNAVSSYTRLLQYQGILPVPSHSKLPYKTIEDIIFLVEKGLTCSQIARELNVSWSTAKRYKKYTEKDLPMLKKRGSKSLKELEDRVEHITNPKKPGRKPITQEDKERILYLRNSQMTVEEVSDVSGFCRSIVIRVCKEWREKGFEVYSRREAVR